LLTTRSVAADDWILERNPSWKVTRLPPGFTLSSIRRSRQDGEGVEHLVYSDGLASLSIYLEPNQGEILEKATLIERGPLNILTTTRKEWRITVVGDVPGTTLSTIAASLERTRKTAADSR
jgi:sigma-E factor negative regulatory protein RseB